MNELPPQPRLGAAPLDFLPTGMEPAAEIARTVRTYCDALQLPVHRLLVLACDAVTTEKLTGIAREVVVFRFSERALQEGSQTADANQEPRLPFTSASFDLVVSYRIIGPVAGFHPFLRDIGRVLHPQGMAVFVAHEPEFAFAPIPAASRTHLMRRWLQESGFRSVQIPARAGETRAIALACPPLSP